MPEAFARPSLQILDRLGRRRAIQPSSQQLTPDNTEHLHVDHMRSRLIGVGGEPVPNLSAARAADQDLAETRGVNDQHRGQLPRCSSRAAMISVCVIGAERRRVRCSVMKWCSATARAYRSTTSTVASAAPRNGAMRSAAVSVAFSVDRVTRTNGSTVTTSRRAFLVDRHTPTT
jgi:hypothetical protein